MSRQDPSSNLSTDGFVREAGHWRIAAANWLRRGRQICVELIYPPQCAFCREEILGPDDGILLCGLCRQQLMAKAHAACPRCGLSVDGPATAAAGSCLQCRQVEWEFSAAFRLGIYRDKLREAMLRMKRPSGELLTAAIAKLLCESRAEDLRLWRPEVVVPIPMHWRRRLGRGANSPDLLAAAVARRLDVPEASRALRRFRSTQPQIELPPEERAENIRGAFRIKSSCDFNGMRVLLVDDVMTTGATANEVAGVFRRQGAADVAIVVVARAESGA